MYTVIPTKIHPSFQIYRAFDRYLHDYLVFYSLSNETRRVGCGQVVQFKTSTTGPDLSDYILNSRSALVV